MGEPDWNSSGTECGSSSEEEGSTGQGCGPGPAFPAAEQPLLRLNVGGTRFVLGRQLAARYPASRIGKLAACQGPAQGLRLCDDYSAEEDEFFFDRDPSVFQAVWQLYRSGRLWASQGPCPRRYRSELRYWGVRLGAAPRCCRLLLLERRQELSEQLRLSRQLTAVLGLRERGPPAPGNWLCRNRSRLWHLLEAPPASAGARLLRVSGCLAVLMSMAGLILGTVPELRPETGAGPAALWGLEMGCSSALTAQLLLRLLSAPRPRRFLLSPLNLAELLALLPFYTELVARRFGEPGRLGLLLRAAPLLRVLRVLSLARYSTGLRAFGFTLRLCSQQVCCLLLFIALGIFTFSALLHQAEQHIPGTNFSSIPQSWWWAAVSNRSLSGGGKWEGRA
ncbi:potassium voltage-gated channel subfamily V member 2-like [Carcharodon carcharias]|uniref:potassium voltage-gated channel subfamily V member 2-like n=1 Tax=Carcharodon carcharias TaxID=13397 RepID=UPI001B7DD721|nr:potassium voltage-gated channel subfamily V member 2-like [Carcharodon carcharias]